MNKIISYYIIGQFGDLWQDIYKHQMNLLIKSNLYDKLDYIDICVAGHETLPFTPNKINNLYYLGYKEEEKPFNRKKYSADKHIFRNMWCFSQLYDNYKILNFGALGLDKESIYYENKSSWREYLENINIGYWQECLELLNYYDCVGTDINPMAIYDNGKIMYSAPHYQGGFWWANSNYIKKLNWKFFHRPVEEQEFLGELWIGTGNPKMYSFHNSNLNIYLDKMTPDYNSIINNTRNHIKELKYLNAHKDFYG
jgi:hypothetical protein